ncbi:MAG: hypothetical protein R2778_02250 [Saprospiraceae bacterium]
MLAGLNDAAGGAKCKIETGDANAIYEDYDAKSSTSYYRELENRKRSFPGRKQKTQGGSHHFKRTSVPLHKGSERFLQELRIKWKFTTTER